MSVLAQGPLRSTFLQMTPLPTPSWTPVKEGQSRRGSHPAAWSVLRSVGGVPTVPPGSPPPTTRWDCSSRSSQTLHPSPYHRRQRRPTSRCWPSRDSRCRWCHVTFLSTNQRAGATAVPPSLGWTTSCRTINLGLTPALLAVQGHLLMCCTERMMGAAATPNNRRWTRRTSQHPEWPQTCEFSVELVQPGHFSRSDFCTES